MVKKAPALAEKILTRVETESAFSEKSGYTLETLRRVLDDELRGKPVNLLDGIARARNRLIAYRENGPAHTIKDQFVVDALIALDEALKR